MSPDTCADICSRAKRRQPTLRNFPGLLNASGWLQLGAKAGGLPVALRAKNTKDAAERRDFTLNAIAYDPIEDRIVDPTGGVRDLEAKLLRAPDRQAFREDPLRVVKAFRMLAQFPGFSLDLTTRTLLEEARA